MPKVLEVCIDSVESAEEAARGGATRLELCANLVIGGTTPSLSLLKAMKRATGLPVHCLLRPRFGDFLYTEQEFSLLLEDGEALLAAGANALVCGCLTPAGALDRPRMVRLIALCRRYGARFTLHRAFDLCRDPMEALAVCQALGVDSILTSGQAETCLAGRTVLRALISAAGPVEIMIGAGVDAAAIRQLRAEIPGAEAFHMSGKRVVPSGMRFRRAGVPMGLPGMSEYEIYRTDGDKVAAARKELFGA